MKCVVPSQNVKVLAKAFHSLGKIGEDLFIEPQRDNLAFRTVNLAESAYASFTFTKTFFSSYTFTEDDNEEGLRCKIAMKSLLVVLKSQHGERLVEWCQIRLDPSGTKVTFQLRYSYGCTKTHFLPILESETLQANYSKDECRNRLSASPKLLSTAVKNFRSTEDEVTLSLMSQKLTLRNHLENNLDSKKALRTEIGLHSAEFETFNIEMPTSVTFCLKELRAVLLFAEYTGLPVHFYVSTAGKPVVFVVNNDTVYEANYVVSTLNESGPSQPLSQTSQSSVATSSRGPTDSKKRTHTEMNNTTENVHYSKVQSKHLNRTVNTSLHNTVPLVLEDGYNSMDLQECELLNSGAAQSVTIQDVNQMDLTSNSNSTLPAVKSVFGRCFNTTFKKQSLPGYDNVLAYDTDGMEDSD